MAGHGGAAVAGPGTQGPIRDIPREQRHLEQPDMRQLIHTAWIWAEACGHTRLSITTIRA